MRSTSDIPAVKEFQPEKYLGIWYEIARLPHSFQQGLENVYVEYEKISDRKISVRNYGYSTARGKWSSVRGKATIKKKNLGIGLLKVRFFGLFGATYKIIKLNRDYSIAVVTSSSRDYLWFLAREKQIPDETYQELRDYASANGFDISRLHKTKHD